MAVLLWIVLIGFAAGVIARFIMPGPNKPRGFVLTTLLGVAGAVIATVVEGASGLLEPGRGAGLLGATIGAIVILFIWNRLVVRNIIPDHGL